MLKIIGCERKCQLFYFLLLEIEIWHENQIKRIIFGIKSTIFVLIRRIFENKNITPSGRNNCFSVYSRFSRHFRLPVTSDTTLSGRTRRFPITCKKPFIDISDLWPVIWSSIFNCVKKLPESWFMIQIDDLHT